MTAARGDRAAAAAARWLQLVQDPETAEDAAGRAQAAWQIIDVDLRRRIARPWLEAQMRGGMPVAVAVSGIDAVLERLCQDSPDGDTWNVLAYDVMESWRRSFTAAGILETDDADEDLVSVTVGGLVDEEPVAELRLRRAAEGWRIVSVRARERVEARP